MLYWDTLHRWRGVRARSSPLPSGPPSDRLGARESGTEKLEQAIQTFRLALQENTRGRSQLTWAPTQAGLDNALKLLDSSFEFAGRGCASGPCLIATSTAPGGRWTW